MSRLESRGRLLPVTGERSDVEQVPVAGLLLFVLLLCDSDNDSVAGGGLREAVDDVTSGRAVTSLLVPAWHGVKLMERSDWLGSLRASVVGVGVRGSSATGLTVAKLRRDRAVVGDCTAPGDVTNDAAPKTKGLSCCLRKLILKTRDAAATDAAEVLGMLADVTMVLKSAEVRAGQLRSCLQCFLLLLTLSSSPNANDAAIVGDVSNCGDDMTCVMTSSLLHCFSNSRSWPRKLKLGEIVGLLSLTYLKQNTHYV